MPPASGPLDNLLEHRSELGLQDPLKELLEENVNSTYETVLVRYRQVHRGVPVYNRGLLVRVLPDKVTVDPYLLGDLDLDIRPAVSRGEALQIALKKHKITGAHETEAELVVVPKNAFLEGRPTETLLAWRIDLSVDNDVDPLVTPELWLLAIVGG